MSLTAQQLTYLKTADQRFQAHVAVFNAYTPTITPPTAGDSTGTQLTPKPIPRITPRYGMVDNGGTIALYGRDSYNRGISYVGDGNISFALDAGSSGTVTDNGNGTADYEAPGAGSGIAQINVTVTNANGSKVAKVFVQYPTTTYDNVVAEVASLSASVSQHGWKMSVRCKGDVSALTVGKGILLYVEDTWAGTTSTFGGYQYSEGQMFGYIADTEYFEDFSGQSWLGLEVVSPWDWVLAQVKVGETLWGSVPEASKLWLADFAPVDAIYHFVNEVTDFTLYHDAILFYDQNHIDNLIIDESDLGTIIADVMARTLCVAYVDRYGALYCIPDPDIRADEFWGTPASLFTGSEALTETVVSDYQITTHQSQRVKKLRLEAFDQNQFQLWAISEMPTGIGDIRELRGLICDSPNSLATWAARKRAQLNRLWVVDVGLWLNHVVDLNTFIDVDLTNPTQTNAPTASGKTWVEAISYRPNIYDGGWQGNWHLNKNTSGDVNGLSGWAGTEQYSGFTGRNPDTGSSQIGAAIGGWQSATGGGAGSCYVFDFVNSGTQGWKTPITVDVPTAAGGPQAVYVGGLGWSATASLGGQQQFTGIRIYIERFFQNQTVTAITVWGIKEDADAHWGYINNAESNNLASSLNASGTFSISWTGSTALSYIKLIYPMDAGTAAPGRLGGWCASARICTQDVPVF